MNARKSSNTTRGYIERSVPALSLTRGDMLGTHNGRTGRTTFRRVERVTDHPENGTIAVVVSGRIVPEILPARAPVVVRVRRTR